jgi:3-oxoadipate enol-lactonase
MDWLSANGVSLRYDMIGAGTKTLVLVHELGGTLESWNGVIEALDLEKDWRIIRYDWRGSGLSEKIVGDIAIGDHSSDLEALLDGLGVTGPVFLAGCAVGGAIALHFAARFPSRTAGVVAMCPATEVTAARRISSLSFAQRVAEQGMGPVIEGGLTASYPPAVRKDSKTYDDYLTKYRANDPRSYAAVLRMVAQQDMNRDLARIESRTLVLWGIHDQARPRELVTKVAEMIPNAQFKEVDTAHFMLIQTPKLVADEIDGFFGRPAKE